MARDVIEKGGAGKKLFDRASAVLGYDLAALCLEGPADRLTATEFSQPAVMVSALAALEELKQTRPDVMQGIGHMAGFSLGEITALVAGEAISFEDGLRIVKARAEAMNEASQKNPGGMGSIVGLADDALKAVVEAARAEAGGVLEVANYLFPKGRVVSGDHKAVDLALKKAEPKAMKCQKLVVGGAFHTSHMQAAKEAVAKVLETVTIQSPKFALYSNVTAKPYQSVDEMKTLLVEQVVSAVRWEETAKALSATGGKIMEVGAGEQLKAMLKRIDKPTWERTENVGHWMPPKN
jgi:[acyl-carrier-protein] S-malonyltransferase